jgi:hypothetical protein
MIRASSLIRTMFYLHSVEVNKAMAPFPATGIVVLKMYGWLDFGRGTWHSCLAARRSCINESNQIGETKQPSIRARFHGSEPETSE